MSELQQSEDSDQLPEQSASTDEANRREALGRLATYTAPAMLALLLSTKQASAAACVSNCPT